MLKQQIDLFIKHLANTKAYSRNTILAYENDLLQFSHYAGKEEIDKVMVKAYIEQLRHKDYASSSIARKVAAIKTFLHYMEDGGKIEADIVSHIDTPKVKRQAQPLLTPEQITRLLDVPNKSRSPKNLRNKVLLHLLYHTNLRITQLVDLTIDQFDGKNLQEKKLKEPLLSYMQDYLAYGRPALLRANINEKALFLNHRGSVLTRQGIWLIIKECAERAGLKISVTPRMLHQSFAAHKETQART